MGSFQLILIGIKKMSKKADSKVIASSGNRTRAARVAGEHSTTEPTMLSCEGRACLQESYITLTFDIYGTRQKKMKLRSR